MQGALFGGLVHAQARAVWGFCTTCRSGGLLRSPSRLLAERLVSGNLPATGALVDLPGDVAQFLHFQIISRFQMSQFRFG